MDFIRRNRNLLPLLILTGLEITTIVAATTPGYLEIYGYLALKTAHVFGFFAIVTCWILFFVNRKLYNYSIMITLGLGILGILNFTPAESFFKISGVQIFQPTSLGVAILALIINADKLKSENQTQTIVTNSKIDDEEIARLLDLYKDKPTEMLKEIISDTRYSTFAKKAAETIIAERELVQGSE